MSFIGPPPKEPTVKRIVVTLVAALVVALTLASVGSAKTRAGHHAPYSHHLHLAV